MSQKTQIKQLKAELLGSHEDFNNLKRTLKFLKVRDLEDKIT